MSINGYSNITEAYLNATANSVHTSWIAFTLKGRQNRYFNNINRSCNCVYGIKARAYREESNGIKICGRARQITGSSLVDGIPEQSKGMSQEESRQREITYI